MNQNQGIIASETSPANQVAHEPASEPVCPYCGTSIDGSTTHIGAVGARCTSCKGLLDDLSLRATQGHMGAWFIRDEAAPFRPGCSVATLRMMIERGKVGPKSTVRGPDTDQFWQRAGSVPRLARLMGLCRECGLQVSEHISSCESCGTELMPLAIAQVERSATSEHIAMNLQASADPSASTLHHAVTGYAASPTQSLSDAIALEAQKKNKLGAFGFGQIQGTRLGEGMMAMPGIGSNLGMPSNLGASTVAKEVLGEAALRRQLQREARTWARRAGLSIGVAASLLLAVVALATKDSWRKWLSSSTPLDQTHAKTTSANSQAPNQPAPATSSSNNPGLPVEPSASTPVAVPEAKPIPTLTPPTLPTQTSPTAPDAVPGNIPGTVPNAPAPISPAPPADSAPTTNPSTIPVTNPPANPATTPTEFTPIEPTSTEPTSTVPSSTLPTPAQALPPASTPPAGPASGAASSQATHTKSEQSNPSSRSTQWARLNPLLATDSAEAMREAADVARQIISANGPDREEAQRILDWLSVRLDMLALRAMP